MIFPRLYARTLSMVRYLIINLFINLNSQYNAVDIYAE